MKECKTCKADFDEKYVNCAPCRKILALKAKEHRRIHGAKINAKRLIKRRSKAKPMSEYPPKTCLHCDKTFQPSKSNWRVAKFCSPKCSSHARIGMDKIYRWEKRPTIKCRECGITSKPVKSDGTTCGKRQCVDESRRKTKIENDIKAISKGGHRYEKYNKYQQAYRKNPRNNIYHRLEAGIKHSLKETGIKLTASERIDLVNYTVEELMAHLESQFTEENGYSWDNLSEWHIDHIRPVTSFNITSTECEDFKKCWALDNLQPLWAKENMSKGNEWDGKINA